MCRLIRAGVGVGLRCENWNVTLPFRWTSLGPAGRTKLSGGKVVSFELPDESVCWEVQVKDCRPATGYLEIPSGFDPTLTSRLGAFPFWRTRVRREESR